jgi:glucosamine--fructose-6-phosphate aminotransferase (isomerizing)
MCGIIGYCGKRQAAPIVFEGLKKLEYRGYDSAGIAILNGSHLIIKKDTGQVEEVNLKHKLSTLPGNTAIGHTRWATHGSVTKANSHPHSDCNERIAVTHNGIIENYEQLRRDLIDSGHHFSSETDTEVIPHLLEEELKNGASSLEKAVLAILPRLEGSYAFAAISLDDPGKIVGTRKNNPLMIGIGKDGYFLSSDTLAFSKHTSKVITLGDAEVFSITAKEAIFYDANGDSVPKEATKISNMWTENHKNGYSHFMLKEIMEESEVLQRVVQQDESKFNAIALDILRANQVIITACGTSRYASLVGRYLFSRVGKKFADVVIASEFGYFADSTDKNTMVIAVSQSGETADVIDGVKTARVAGGTILSIINRPNSILESLSHQTILLNCGFEIGVAATKSFLSQIAAFYLLSFSMINKFGYARDQIMSICNRIDKVQVRNHRTLVKLVQRFKNSSDFYYIARGINFAVASEAALKLKEISYIHAEGMPAGELKHGTLALIEKGTPVVVICPDDYTYEAVMNNAMEAKSRGAYIIAVSDRKSDIYDCWLRIPKVDDLLYPMVAIVPLQLLAYHMAIARGCDPDKPRNLAKSVTVR